MFFDRARNETLPRAIVKLGRSRRNARPATGIEGTGIEVYPKTPHYGPPMGTTTMFDPLIANGAPVLRALGTSPGKPIVE